MITYMEHVAIFGIAGRELLGKWRFDIVLEYWVG